MAYPDANTVKILFDKLEIELTYLDLECLHLAAASYGVFLKRNKRALRQQIRSQKRILPDFYIGALATIQGLPLLTRDLKRKWNLDFPSLEIVTP